MSAGCVALGLLAGLSGCDAFCAFFGISPSDCAFRLGQTASDDLQVTIEVRFIAVDDDFFERIGVDFDSNVEAQPINGSTNNGTRLQPDNATLAPSNQTGGTADTQMFIPRELSDLRYFLPTVPQNETARDVNVFPGLPGQGVTIPPNGATVLPDLNDLPGGIMLEPWTDSGLSSFGFAILSDIEAFFFLEAAQADERSNILTAPKVTLFNGQQALVLTQNESTLVSDVEKPFADAVNDLDPTIQTVQSGPMFEIQPVISADRRFIQMNIIPVRAIQVVPNHQVQANGLNSSVLVPIVQLATVQTTVSVPDGGTVLLGGMITLDNPQYERGVPVLNRLPYINRLFKNTGTIKDTQSLLLMVTPRIIIQEEEEQ